MDNNKVIRLVFSLTAVSLFALPLCAHKLTKQQKKDIDQAKTYIKSGKDYDKAEKLITPLLKDSVNRNNLKLNALWFDAVKGQYDAANEKLYLKQKYDTAAFYQLTRHLQEVALTLDSLDARPDKKGRVRPSYRKENADLLHALRINIYYGGTWHVRKANYQTAFSYFDEYIAAARQPLFEAYKYHQTDSLLPQAAYWATFCGYKMKDPVLTLRHRQVALRDTSKAAFTLQFVAEARLWLNDHELYLATLQEGFRRFPEFHYFFPRLMDVYTEQGEFDRALAVADSALAVNDTSELFLFAKCTTLLRMERFTESIKYGEILLSINSSLPEPYYNIGMAYTNMASSLDSQGERAMAKEAYQRARTYMESYRERMPDEKDKWAPALYQIYLNLNMGRQFDEIDRLLK